MDCEIRPVGSLVELAEVFDVIGAQFRPVRTRTHRGFVELAALLPERQAVMLLAADQRGRTMGGAYLGKDWTLAIDLEPDARGKGLGRRLVEALEQAAAKLGCSRIVLGGATADTEGFYLRLGYQGRGTMISKGLGQSAWRRDPEYRRSELTKLRQQRASDNPTPTSASPPDADANRN